ncbi:aldose epimerase family protein [Crocosphaera chwakensis]|uniref:Aldose 1-epimerase n=1 Tax=Crocosphaera chwakensis CCY0110 TaxID=391612 RepID=A3ISI0_9CHRO|nr:aldose 1-epimerase [Crocosphaera chwakensis]EAZ90550.1 Aldose 1-epimerase [Crocosphaera chwakensis CCY0110]
MSFSISARQNQYITYILSDESALSRLEVVPERGGMITRWSIEGQEVFYLDEERFSHPELTVRGGVPILFPICGDLPDNVYVYDNKAYHLKQHGLARNFPWEVTEQSTDSCCKLTLSLKSNEETLKMYPFEFELRLMYELKGKTLKIYQEYINKSDKVMPFSFGLHPYFLVKDKEQMVLDIPASSYQVKDTKEIIPYDGNFDFNEEEIDVALKSLKRPSASIQDRARGLKVTLKWSDEYSTMVFWTLKGKEYVCFEPWSAPRNAISTGENITELEPGATCEAVVEIDVTSV